VQSPRLGWELWVGRDGMGWTVFADAAPKLHVCEHEWSWELWDGMGWTVSADTAPKLHVCEHEWN